MGMIDDVGISKLAYRPLELIWVLDTSRSMCGERIIALNNAIRESIPDMNEALKENPSVNVNVSSIVYNTGAVADVYSQWKGIDESLFASGGLNTPNKSKI